MNFASHPLARALRQHAADLAACLRFYTRLPVPPMPFETAPFAMPDFSRIVRMLPLAGALIGALAALVLGLAMLAGLPPLIAATLALASMVVASGALHEDGLADCADGFGGGTTLARKLEIMKDSRIGTYGAAALVLSLLLRVMALGTLAGHGFWQAALGLVAAAGISRALGLLPLVLLAPARMDGAGFAAGRPSPEALMLAAGLALALALLPLLAGVPVRAVLAAGFWAGLLAYCMVGLAKAQIGGQTGDVAGAAQQVAEVGFLLGMVAGTG